MYDGLLGFPGLAVKDEGVGLIFGVRQHNGGCSSQSATKEEQAEGKGLNSKPWPVMPGSLAVESGRGG